MRRREEVHSTKVWSDSRRRPWPTGGGFTLVELLTVIAIIGILAAILIPTVGRVRRTAQRAVDASNLREIVKASLLYAAEHHDRLPDPQLLAATFPDIPPVLRVPAALARAGILTDPALYFSAVDPHFPGDLPLSILDPDAADRNRLAADFESSAFLAWEFVGGVRLDDPAQTPVAYTRGLGADGTWDADAGVYGDAGGYVAYLGGNVVYYPTLAGQLVSNASGRKVDDLRQAVPWRSGNPARLYATPVGAVLLGSPEGVSALPGP